MSNTRPGSPANGEGKKGGAVSGAVWSIGLIVSAAAAPAYESTTETSSGAVTSEAATLLDENGPVIWLPIGAPLLVTVVVGSALWRREGSRGTGPIAWSFTMLLAGFAVLAMASIGLCARRARRSPDRDLSITPM
jgi:hypothetical protein